MGTSYQTVVVAASIESVRCALEADQVEALLVPAGPDRTAVLPSEGDHDFVDPGSVAEALSADLKVDALAQVVFDSDLIFLDLYRGGERIFEYVSDPAMRASLDGEPAPPPSADPAGDAAFAAAALAPLGVGQVDLAMLAATLRTDQDGWVFAEAWHAEILTVLNLDPTAATMAFRWAVSEDLPGAVRTVAMSDADAIEQSEWWPFPVIIYTAIPLDVDPADAAQVLADAIADQTIAMRTHVGYAPVVPGAAVNPASRFPGVPIRTGQQSATYFAQILIRSPGRQPNYEQVITAIDNAWVTAWRDRYGITAEQEPAFAPTTYDRFRIGFGHTHERRTTTDHPIL
ncbi:hypothetical protein [Virgisporangium aurantiacum]|uniref:Uncharacterized protein n=1 Tax=Virgisporangium aurantiacum TaxID=175570 RepID=A0A8J3ZH65_9ACTN|nr:hypothetical protein [Virgisporangium aurantiacum]GIJ63809.1 hypothetical protein Vau01_113250 [Virgisporangium aurantiacum]